MLTSKMFHKTGYRIPFYLMQNIIWIYFAWRAERSLRNDYSQQGKTVWEGIKPRWISGTLNVDGSKARKKEVITEQRFSLFATVKDLAFSQLEIASINGVYQVEGLIIIMAAWTKDFSTLLINRSFAPFRNNHIADLIWTKVCGILENFLFHDLKTT